MSDETLTPHRPSRVFCFLGELGVELYRMLPGRIAQRLREPPKHLAFLGISKAGARYHIAHHGDPAIRSRGGWTERTEEAASKIFSSRTGREAREAGPGPRASQPAQVYLVQSLSDPLGVPVLFSLVKLLRDLNGGSASELHGVFALPADAAQRAEGLKGLRWVEAAVMEGVLGPSVVVDAGVPTAAVPLLNGFLTAMCDGELAGKFWQLLERPRAGEGAASGASPTIGLGTFGLASVSLDREALARELAALRSTDLGRQLIGSSDCTPPSDADCRGFLADREARKLSHQPDGAQRFRADTVEWLQRLDPRNAPDLGRCVAALGSLRRVAESVAQRGKNERASGMFESGVAASDGADGAGRARPREDPGGSEPPGAPPPKRFWETRATVSLPFWLVVLPLMLGGGVTGGILGLLLQSLAACLAWGFIGLVCGLLVGALNYASWGKQTIHVGRLPHAGLAGGYPTGETKKVGWVERKEHGRVGIGLHFEAELREAESVEHEADLGPWEAVEERRGARAGAPDEGRAGLSDAGEGTAGDPDELRFLSHELARLERELEGFCAWLRRSSSDDDRKRADAVLAGDMVREGARKLRRSWRTVDAVPLTMRLLTALSETARPGLPEIFADQVRRDVESVLQGLTINDWLKNVGVPKPTLKEHLDRESRLRWSGAGLRGFSLRRFSGELSDAAEPQDLSSENGRVSEALSIRLVGGISSRDLG